MLTITGIGLILLQMLFGLWLVLFAWIPWIRPAIPLTTPLSDSTTLEGAKDSLVHFGSAALLAGISASLTLTIAVSLMRKGRAHVFTGILLITAGAANSVILFSAGLPAGAVLMAAGVLMLSNDRKGEEGKQKPT
ncbi:hypothetical protein [Sporolactobacillus vineae]|uniref:hypothetical protein n=1 Tax=Sporolactobacillus vineae TaxID=444463 RepID=UPI00028A216F|nr:hypothetical protein [Sporolactobacillus vineae]